MFQSDVPPWHVFPYFFWCFHLRFKWLIPSSLYTVPWHSPCHTAWLTWRVKWLHYGVSWRSFDGTSKTEELWPQQSAGFLEPRLDNFLQSSNTRRGRRRPMDGSVRSFTSFRPWCGSLRCVCGPFCIPSEANWDRLRSKRFIGQLPQHGAMNSLLQIAALAAYELYRFVLRTLHVSWDVFYTSIDINFGTGALRLVDCFDYVLEFGYMHLVHVDPMHSLLCLHG